MYPDPDAIALERIDVFLPCGCAWILAVPCGGPASRCVECAHKTRWRIEIRDTEVVGVWRPGAGREKPAEEAVLNLAWAHDDGTISARGHGLEVLACAVSLARDIRERRKEDVA